MSGEPSRSYAEALARYESLVTRAARADSMREYWREAWPEAFPSDPFGFDSIRAIRDEATLRIARGVEPELGDDFDRLLARADSAVALEAEIVELDSLATLYGGRFRLYTGCAPVRIGVFFGPDDHEERSREMAETRLRNAGIWGGEEPMGELVVHFGVTLSVSTDATEAWLTKAVWDPVSGGAR